jgi:hypothetical protein
MIHNTIEGRARWEKETNQLAVSISPEKVISFFAIKREKKKCERT